MMELRASDGRKLLLRLAHANYRKAPLIHYARDGQKVTCCGRRISKMLPGAGLGDATCGICRAWLSRHFGVRVG